MNLSDTFVYCSEQYEYVRSSRAVLFNYCLTISDEDFINSNNSFGRGGSIRSLLIHIANTYEFWIGTTALKRTMSYTNHETNPGKADVVIAFDKVDMMMADFFTAARKDSTQQIAYELNGKSGTVSILKLFSHVITHEYHHKGQILSLSRHLGYIPVDTDIMR